MTTRPDLGGWYHRIELSDGSITPGTRDQGLVFAICEPYLPDDLSDLTVLDLGANAGGLSIEFARRGAKVVAVEIGSTYLRQMQFVLDDLGLTDRVEQHRLDLYRVLELQTVFDIVCYVGLSYHLRYPQLALDLLTHVCGGALLASTQTIQGVGLTMTNRAAHQANRDLGTLYGWEPTEQLFAEMLAHAGFQPPDYCLAHHIPGRPRVVFVAIERTSLRKLHLPLICCPSSTVPLSESHD